MSGRSFKDSQVRLQLFALAHNHRDLLRSLALPRSVKNWSLTALREKLMNIGTNVVTHSRYVMSRLARVAVPRDLFARTLEGIQWFGVPPQAARAGLARWGD